VVRSRRMNQAALAAFVAMAAPALADGPAPSAAPLPTAAPSAEGGLRAAVEGLVGAPVHGTLTTRYRLRRTDEGTDQDVYETLDARFGDAAKDRVSGALFVRAFADLDRAHQGEPGFAFESIDDTRTKSVNALLYSAYAQLRPTSGPFETIRLGRQYVYAAETFHVDGVSAATAPLVDSVKLRLTGWGGVPVHFYEASASGDWLAGVRAQAEPWKAGRAAVDFVHVEDRFSLLGAKERNNLTAVSVGHLFWSRLDVDGRFTWLEGPRDASLRATWSAPQSDFLVQGSYYRLIEAQSRLATEFDPYSNVILDLERYQQVELRASKGFGDHFDVEVGASARDLLQGAAETPFNRDTRRVYVTPSLSDLPWKGTSVSVTGESYSGRGERLQTWGADVTHRFGPKFRASIGTDYSLYAFGPLGTDERSHVRTAYARVKFPLTTSLTADVRYTWEKDDAETFHVLQLALTFEF
jgi:hypothetical protein